MRHKGDKMWQKQCKRMWLTRMTTHGAKKLNSGFQFHRLVMQPCNLHMHMKCGSGCLVVRGVGAIQLDATKHDHNQGTLNKCDVSMVT